MSFDSDEKMSSPLGVGNKLSMGEDYELFSEEKTIFTEDYPEQNLSIYDKKTQSIINEKRVGICVTCRGTSKGFKRCMYGCQICNECSTEFQGRPICRRHVESNFASKYESMVLLGIISGLSRPAFLKLGKMSGGQYEFIKMRILERGLIKFPFNELDNRPKITGISFELILLAISTYGKDADFKLFLQKIGANQKDVQGAEER